MRIKQKDPLRILLDLRILQGSDALRGIGHYTAGLTKAIVQLAQTESNAQFAILQDAARDNARICSDLALPVFKIEQGNSGSLIKRACRFLSSTTGTSDISAVASEWNADLMHIASPLHGPFRWQPATGHCPTVATLYDLIPLEHREAFIDKWPETMRNLYLQRLKRLEKLDGIVAISESAGRSLERHTAIEFSTLCVAYPGLREPFASLAEPELPFDARYGFVAFMSDNPSKNSHSVVEAYQKINSKIQTRHPLILIMPANNSDYIQVLKCDVDKMGMTENVTFVDAADDQTLLQAMLKARAFILPSTHEGFGLPAIEAAACGMLVLASDIPVLREVMQSGARYFKPTSIQELSEAMNRVDSDNEDINAVVAVGKKRAREFDWKCTAQKVWKYYLDLIERKARK
jgi:glycosyltransferase involved in cell wall biosynthesis